MTITKCHIAPLDRYNWELCLALEITPEQERYVPSVLYSLAQAKFENLFPFGIWFEGKIVGFLMYGGFGNICWINRILVDKQYQGKGIGREAVRQLIQQLRQKRSCQSIRTSYAADNYQAKVFFEKLGFEELNDALEEERVAEFSA